jgi:hypothetical protein
MEWLRVIALGVLSCFLGGTLWGQEKAANSAGAGSFTVTGDVEKPGNYRFEDTITVRSAVAVASPVSDAVNVTVLRNGHDRAQSTRLLRLSSVDSGELAMSGDILVVESLAVMSRPVLPNAVVRSGASTTVVSLEDAGVVIGDVLRGLGIPCDGETRVSLPCRIHGLRSAESVAVSVPVRHGDVITVGGTAVAAVYGESEGYSGMRPLVSEWSSAARRSGSGGVGVKSGSGSGAVRSEPRLPEFPAVSAVPEIRGELRANGEAAGASVEGAVGNIPRERSSGISAEPVRESEVPVLPKPGASRVEKSDSRVTIVGEGREKSALSSGRDEVLLLAESLRPVPSGVDQDQARDGISGGSRVRTGKSVSGSGSRPTISAAVSTRTEAEPAREAAVDSSRGVHWAVIVGLFVAGVWVLGRSLLVGSTTAAAERSVVAAVPGELRSVSVEPALVAAVAAVPAVPATGAVSGVTAAVAPGIPGVSVKSVAADGAGLAGQVSASAAASEGQPWRIYSVPRGLRRGDVGVEADDLDLLIENRIPVERGEPRVPDSLELTGRPSVGRGGVKLRVDGPHAVAGEPHLSGGELRLRRGRSLEDRLSQLIRAVPTGNDGARRGSSVGVSSGAAGAEQ